MLKKTIQYEDFDGKQVQDDFYFNLSKSELMELELSAEGGFGEYLQKIVKLKDGAKIIDEFKKIILMAYGQKSEDGKRFIKNAQLNEEFQQTEAFSELFMELATDPNKAAEFVNALIPKGLEAQMAKLEAATDNDPKDEVDNRPDWVKEGRRPTNAELQKMPKDEMVEAFKRNYVDPKE